MRRHVVTGLFADGGRRYGKFFGIEDAREAAKDAIGDGAQQAIITLVQETHIETIRGTEKE